MDFIQSCQVSVQWQNLGMNKDSVPAVKDTRMYLMSERESGELFQGHKNKFLLEPRNRGALSTLSS